MKKSGGNSVLMEVLILILLILFGCMKSLTAQDYLINFSAMGAGTSVSSVKIENLTSGAMLTINGTDILHLVKTSTGINDLLHDQGKKVTFSPNPMKEYSRMEFYLPAAGETDIDLIDLNGRKVLHTRDFLPEGHQVYRIHGLATGIYFARVSSGNFSAGGSLLCSNNLNNKASIVFEETAPITGTGKASLPAPESATRSKGSAAEIQMQYNSGDILKLTGSLSSLSTIVTDVPTSGKTIQFKLMDCTDGDFNHYPVVKIGSQIWMAENLKTTTYNDLSTAIPLVTENAAWGSLGTPAYCWYNNDAATFKTTYGALYNWHAVNTGNLCPSGWHLPGDAEFTEMTTYLGASAGGKLKETGTLHWTSPNTGATNETGFTALPGGDRGGSTWGFEKMGASGSWYSSTADGEYNALGRALGNSYAVVATLHAGRSVGASVRCVRNISVPPAGEWAINNATGAIVFLVDASGTKITRVNYMFSELHCGPVTIGGGITCYQTPGWPVTGGSFSISNNLDPYGNQVFTLSGSYDAVNRKYTGTWTFNAYGSICTGTWEAFLLN